ncbi:glycoside hydrolase family 31 protein [Paenibacillus durus]|uniref:Alpha-glucosidase n=1 Tax=Paenibacillus durus ATCC 35681 TaxID=1333534 RepID=A0A0F7CHM1_PAEDU|nr:TIM-barrel domain-containing protein [Paenibacillus durus]AKG34606.1 alpha-glucosidase [Paenibacillus durus ATCC 35681]
MLTSEQISPDKMQADYAAGFTRTLGRVQAVTAEVGLILFSCENGKLAVSRVRTGIIRIKLFAGAEPGDPIHLRTTEAVIGYEENPGGKEAELQVSDTESAYRIETDGITVEVAKQDSSLRFINESGQILAHNPLLAWNEDKAAAALFQATEHTHYYGLGEKTGFLDKRGERYEMWNSDNFSPHVPEIEALYQSIPFLIVNEPGNAYGIFLDNPGRSVFDMRGSEQAFTIHAETGGVDYYFIAGPKLKDVVGRYTALTGRIQLPPRWSIGYHQSRYSYMDQEEVLELARTFREKEIPCDVIHLDIHYMNEYRVFTFDPVRFPDPKAMIAELKNLGIRIVPIIDPGVKFDPDYHVYQEGAESNYFCLKPDGTPFIGPVWPGQSVFPDFTEAKVREWWGGLHRFFTEMGIEGIWNDMNEPSVFNECKTIEPDTLHGNDGHPATHQEIHNLYGMMMSKATAEGMTSHLGGRPFVLSRAGYAGIQRYAAVWTGDNRSYWEHMALAMPMVLNLGLSGVAFAGPDIGGFGHHTTGELLARWTQMGALFPFCRNHSMLDTIRQEPWSFGTDVENICRDYISLRYSLMPLLYSVFREAAETGMPVIRPLLLEYPDDPNTVNLCDQFLLGDQLLAAPVYRPNTYHRVVYLPEGNWFDYWTGERRRGGGHFMAHAPLDTLPLYVKEGAMIPRTEPAASTEFQRSRELLLLDIYTPENGASAFDLYDDDGTTYAFKDNFYNLHRLTVEEAEGRVKFRIQPACIGYDEGWKRWTVTFKHLRFAGCRLDFGTEVPSREELETLAKGWHFDRAAGELTVVMNQPLEDMELLIQAL